MQTLSSDGEGGAEPPKLEVQDAINALKACNDNEILSWLAFARSIQLDFQLSPSSGCLPFEIVNAIMSLRVWSNEFVL